MEKELVFVVCPRAIRKLCERMGIGYAPLLGDRMIESLNRRSEVVRWEDTPGILVKFRAHGDSGVREVGFALRTSKVFSGKEVAGLTLWPEKVSAYGDPPGLLSEWEERNRRDEYRLVRH